MYFFFICTFLLLFGCGNRPYMGKDTVGADEFVMDSYKIRQGKFSILQLEGKNYAELSPDLLNEYQDVIQDGDVLYVAVFHPSRSDISAAIEAIGSTVGFQIHKGTLRLPDLEPIPIEGLTLDDASQKIQSLYSTQIRDVQVFLSYKDRLERKVELAGLVLTPTIPVDGRLRLFETLSKAKVPPNANLFKSYVVRDNQMLPVDLYKLLKEGDMSQNIVMRGSDKIYIADPSASTLMVLGEVGKERLVDVPNGFMTIRQALAEAGGIPFTGNKSYIQIIRGNILNPKIYTVTWDHVIHLPSDSMLLIPGDIIYVAASPITNWNRFMSQLLPTFVNIDLVRQGIKGIGVNVP
ncbi:MAG: polysaccharide biosynthesis/export family protein [Verrucomicrobia bacterium]|nr:polysaccharide biosynthesis/export family protein [Verrucomicrobiota bacterium]